VVRRLDAMTKKTAYLKIGVWFNEATEHIHISSQDGGGFISTVCNDPNNKRGNPNLYGKLGKILRENGLPSPLPNDAG
jgi:hypothetical protein